MLNIALSLFFISKLLDIAIFESNSNNVWKIIKIAIALLEIRNVIKYISSNKDNAFNCCFFNMIFVVCVK